MKGPLLMSGIGGKSRAQIATLRQAGSAAEQEAVALQPARELDAEEVGRRADERRRGREAAELADTTASEGDAPPR